MSDTSTVDPLPGSTGKSGVWEIFVVFLRLGLTSFGGPTAHIGYFRDAFVGRRRWLTDAEYADLVALCQFLPGPASSQVGFAIGLRRGGWAGAAAAWLGFTLPSAVVLVAFGLSLTRWTDPENAGWLKGLAITAVVVVAKAVQSMAESLCPDRRRAALALLSAMLVLAWPGGLSQIVVIIGGACYGWLLLRDLEKPTTKTADPGIAVAVKPAKLSWGRPVLCLSLLASLLTGLPLLAAQTGSVAVQVMDGFFRTGSLVFGGGHVVLPLLKAETVGPGLVDESAFLAGYGAAQAVPGPLFTFAAFLGSVMNGDSVSAPVLACVALVAVFAPSWLLVGGLLPLWEKMRSVASLRRALAGTNAAVVGLLGAALYRPVWTGAISDVRDVVFLLGVALLLLVAKWPPWLVVVVAAAAGAMLL